MASILTTVIPPYLQGICSKTPSGCLKLGRMLNPIYAMLVPIQTHSSCKGGTLRLPPGMSSAGVTAPALCGHHEVKSEVLEHKRCDASALT